MESRLAAIFALDMVAYSRLIEADEAGTLARLTTLRGELIDPTIESHGGRVVKGTGDGVLAEFSSAAGALACATEIQGEMAERESGAPTHRRIDFRIGINVGKVLAEDGDIYGNGVNVAARIESLADPGGILISGSAYKQLADRSLYQFEDLGLHLVKNIKKPVRVFRVLPSRAGGGARLLVRRLGKRKIVQWALAYFAGAWLVLEVFDLIAEQFMMPVWVRQGATVLLLFGVLITLVLAWYHGERGRQKVSMFEAALLIVLLGLAGQSIWMLKDRDEQAASGVPEEAFQFRDQPLPRQSVAVLPCANLSDDKDQGYFADGLAAELITRLAAVSGLHIPSHTSSFSFRGHQVTIEAVAAALKVRHVLECDVIGGPSRIRIGARLIDGESGYTLWSESYDRARSDLLEIQQEVARAVVRNLEIRLGDREELSLGRRWTENVEAYDHFLRGIESQLGFPTEAQLAESFRHLERSVELDPEFGRAYARLAIHWLIMSNFSYTPPHRAFPEIKRLARKAIDLDGELFEAHWALGWAQFAGDYAWKDAEESFRTVIRLAPGEWQGYHSLGFVLGVLGRYDEAMAAARIATDLDPLAYWPRRGIEILHSRQRDFDASIAVTLEIATRGGWNPFLQAHMAWLSAHAGRTNEARDYLRQAEDANSQDINVQLFLAVAHGLLGNRDRALNLTEPWKRRRNENPDLVPAGSLAFAYVNMGDLEQAMELLLEARERQEVEILFLDDPSFDGLRADPRFVALIRELELPEYIYLAPFIGEKTSGSQ